MWGKLGLLVYVLRLSQVHPHACGENEYVERLPLLDGRFTPTRVGKTIHSSSSERAAAGSPPRVWGKHEG